MKTNTIDQICTLESETAHEVKFTVESSMIDHAGLIAYPYELRGVRMKPGYKQVDEEGEILYWVLSGRAASGQLITLTIYND